AAASAESVRGGRGPGDLADPELPAHALIKAEPQPAARRCIRQHGDGANRPSEPPPSKLFRRAVWLPLKESLISNADPRVSATIGSDRPDVSARQARGSYESVPVEWEHGFVRGGPHATSVVHTQRPGHTVEQGYGAAARNGRLLSVKGDVPVFPSIQTFRRGDPDASIRGGLHRPGVGTGKTLVRRNGRKRIFTEPVESAGRADPDVPFAVFINPMDSRTGEAVADP